MSLDFVIASREETAAAGIEESLHAQLMATAKQLRLGTLIRLDDYYVRRAYAASEVPALRRDLQQAAAKLKHASAVFAKLDAVLARAEQLRVGIDVEPD